LIRGAGVNALTLCWAVITITKLPRLSDPVPADCFAVGIKIRRTSLNTTPVGVSSTLGNLGIDTLYLASSRDRERSFCTGIAIIAHNRTATWRSRVTGFTFIHLAVTA
jgi:hypothetical protein